MAGQSRTGRDGQFSPGVNTGVVQLRPGRLIVVDSRRDPYDFADVSEITRTAAFASTPPCESRRIGRGTCAATEAPGVGALRLSEREGHLDFDEHRHSLAVLGAWIKAPALHGLDRFGIESVDGIKRFGDGDFPHAAVSEDHHIE